jgi:hypothetical protein
MVVACFLPPTFASQLSKARGAAATCPSPELIRQIALSRSRLIGKLNNLTLPLLATPRNLHNKTRDKTGI